jgi:UDP-N-acetyl-D-glucosamine dehydrogenase
MKKINKVAVVGLGYVGLPLFVAINKAKQYEVVGYEISQKKVDLLNNGQPPIQDEIVEDFLKDNGVTVSNDEAILEGADVYIVCVPTPVHDDFNPDYGPVMGASKTVAKYIKEDDHFVLESTVNPGTCDEIVTPILEAQTKMTAGKDFNIAHCPERINPGDPKWNVYNINRNIGSAAPYHSDLSQQIANFYRSVITDAEINEVSSLKVAEATKILENTFRDVNIALVNEIAKSFDLLDIDLVETIDASSNKPFGFMAHYPGCGVGGHCIAVDPYFLINRAARSGFDHKFLKMARKINNSMPEYTIRKLILTLNKIGLPVKDTKVALLGLSYKPDVKDLRESPALKIKQRLINLGADLTVYDPYVTDEPMSLEKAIKNVKAVVIATAHTEFTEKLIDLLPETDIKVVIDGRNCLDLEFFKQNDIEYKGIGRYLT